MSQWWQYKKNPILDAELKQLNQNVDAAIKARKTWMDSHMNDYAKYHVGDVLYNMKTGEKLGTVGKLYRYQADQNPLRDTSMSIDYELQHDPPQHMWFDNTSRQPYLIFGTWDEYIKHKEIELESAKWQAERELKQAKDKDNSLTPTEINFYDQSSDPKD